MYTLSLLSAIMIHKTFEPDALPSGNINKENCALGSSLVGLVYAVLCTRALAVVDWF